MEFKYSLKGFSSYLFGKDGFVVRLPIVTNHKHYKGIRLISYRKDNRLVLYSDKGKKETLSKIAIKKRGFLKLDSPVYIPLSCDLFSCPF
jgi:hypothetical protein|tara:strand:- start:72 stop:341 length:270 start_codon:yes stop_codon:yes gene_type:complete